MNKEQVHNEIDELIVSYLSGELDKASFAHLKQWTAESDEHRSYVRKSLEVGFSASIAGNTKDFSCKWGYAVFRQRVADYNREMDAYRTHFPWKTIGWVAAVGLLILFPLTGFWLGKQTMNRHFAMVKIETSRGAHTQLTLPDGTEVWLDADSRLIYPQDFGINNRQLTLKGKAYFDVTHNPAIPFEINTQEIDLKVLGTKFIFSNYPDDETITVDLSKGKVSLNDNSHHQQMYLSPNERMTYDKRTGEMKKTQINAENSASWTKEELYFDELPLSDIAKELARTYNVQIDVAEHLKNKSFYGNFKISTNSVNDILKTFSSTGEINFKYKNGKYVIY